MEIVEFDDPDEHLYVRVEDRNISNGQVLPAAVSLPDWSTNRQRFSEPDDVLKPGFTKVGEFKVSTIPKRIAPDDSAPGETAPSPWLFYAAHDPVPGNYAHSEVRGRREGTPYDPEKKPSSAVFKKKIRMALARIIRLR